MIVRAGLRILDKDGLEALTMRRVAQQLDTGAASLYVYVDNRDALLAAMLEEVLGRVRIPKGGDWRKRLRTLVTSTVEAMSRHEGLALVALGAIPTGLNALLILDRMLAMLLEGGLDDKTAAWSVDLMYLYIAAAAAEQSAYDGKTQSAGEYIAEVDRHYAALPADRYPMITAKRAHLLSGGDRSTWALHVLVNGILATPVE